MLCALPFPSLDHTPTGVGPSAVPRIDAENNGADRELELCKTMEILWSCFQRRLGAETLLIEQLKWRGNLRASQPLNFGDGISRGSQDVALFSNPLLMPEFIFSRFHGKERKTKILPAFLCQQI